MKRKVIESAVVPKPHGGASQALAVDGEQLTFVSQVLPYEEGRITPGAATQMRVVMDHLKELLDAAGLEMDNIARTTLYIADMGALDAVLDVYREGFLTKYPTLSIVGVAGLPGGATVGADFVLVS